MIFFKFSKYILSLFKMSSQQLAYIKQITDVFRVLYPGQVNWTKNIRSLKDRPNIIARLLRRSLFNEQQIEYLGEMGTITFWSDILLNRISNFLEHFSNDINNYIYTDVELLRDDYQHAIFTTDIANRTREQWHRLRDMENIEAARQAYENRLFNLLDYEVDEARPFNYYARALEVNAMMNGTIEEFREILQQMTNRTEKSMWLLNKLSRNIKISDWKQPIPEECAVCCEAVTNKDYLSCGHCIHKTCVIKSNKTTCPCCRKEVELNKEELNQYQI